MVGSSGGWVELPMGGAAADQFGSAAFIPQVDESTRLRVPRPRLMTASCHSDWTIQGAGHIKIA
jgi:hypothetical protein